MPKSMKIKSKLDVSLRKPLLGDFINKDVNKDENKDEVNKDVNKDEDEDIRKFLEKNEYELIKNPLGFIENTRFYWTRKKKCKKNIKHLNVDHEIDIPKNFISKNLGNKKEYIDCTYFLGYLVESVKELRKQLNGIEKKMVILSQKKYLE